MPRIGLVRIAMEELGFSVGLVFMHAESLWLNAFHFLERPLFTPWSRLLSKLSRKLECI